MKSTSVQNFSSVWDSRGTALEYVFLKRLPTYVATICEKNVRAHFCNKQPGCQKIVFCIICIHNFVLIARILLKANHSAR